MNVGELSEERARVDSDLRDHRTSLGHQVPRPYSWGHLSAQKAEANSWGGGLNYLGVNVGSSPHSHRWLWASGEGAHTFTLNSLQGSDAMQTWGSVIRERVLSAHPNKPLQAKRNQLLSGGKTSKAVCWWLRVSGAGHHTRCCHALGTAEELRALSRSGGEVS